MAKAEQELIVITKMYDLVLWSCNHTGRFPRNHRFVLGERLERNLVVFVPPQAVGWRLIPRARCAARRITAPTADGPRAGVFYSHIATAVSLPARYVRPGNEIAGRQGRVFLKTATAAEGWRCARRFVEDDAVLKPETLYVYPATSPVSRSMFLNC